MNYGHIVIANSKKGITPAVIRFFTKSKYSHSLLTVPDMCEVRMCMEAADSGVSHLRFDKGYLQNTDQDILIYDLQVSLEIKDAAIRECLNILQEGYGFLELPWFVWRAVCKLFGKDIRSQDNWSQCGIICSELCVKYLTACGLGYLFEGFGRGSVNAEDLRNIMDANPTMFVPVDPRCY